MQYNKSTISETIHIVQVESATAAQYIAGALDT